MTDLSDIVIALELKEAVLEKNIRKKEESILASKDSLEKMRKRLALIKQQLAQARKECKETSVTDEPTLESVSKKIREADSIGMKPDLNPKEMAIRRQYGLFGMGFAK